MNDWFDLRVALASIEDPDLVEAVVLVFEELHAKALNEEIDIVVMAARRLACLYQVLINAGMPPIPCIVVSDRVLDLGEDFSFVGKTVIVLDDCLILGRTLASLADRIRLRSPRSVKAIAICADEQQMSRAVVAELKPELKCVRSTRESQRFSLNIAQVLYRNMVPYLTDFPITRVLNLEAQTYFALLSLPEWHSVDTTPRALEDGIQPCYSLLPSPAARAAIVASLGADISQHLGPIKVRFFVDYEGLAGRAALVPIALLNSMSATEVEDALREIDRSLGEEPTLEDGWYTWHAEAKFRLLGMYVSAVVLRQMWADLKSQIPEFQKLTVDLFDFELVKLHFGASISSRLEHGLNQVLASTPEPSRSRPRVDIRERANGRSKMSLADSLAERDHRVLEALAAAKEFLQPTILPSTPGRGEILRLGESFVRPIAGVFGAVGLLERRRRRHLRLMPESTEQRRWLNEGLSLSFLAGAVESDDADVVVSLALDVCNDLGITVPIVFTERVGDDDVVGKKYRIGENVYLAFDGLEQGRRFQSWTTNRARWLVSFLLSRSAELGLNVAGGPDDSNQEVAVGLLKLVAAQSRSGMQR